MTDETRETLTVLALELEKTAATCDRLGAESSTRSYRQHADRRRKEAAALRDVLTPRTCSTCRWVRHVPAPPIPGDTEPVCAHESEAHPLHWCSPVGNADTFGCNYWQAREGEGGTR